MRGRGHQECLEHIRGQFESLHGVTVTCGFTTDGKNVAGMAFWFSSIENYGAISCGELTYSNINTAYDRHTNTKLRITLILVLLKGHQMTPLHMARPVTMRMGSNSTHVLQ